MRSSPRMELAHGTGRSTDFAGDVLARARFRLLVFLGVGLVDAAFILSSSASTCDFSAFTIHFILAGSKFRADTNVLCCRTINDTQIHKREEMLDIYGIKCNQVEAAGRQDAAFIARTSEWSSSSFVRVWRWSADDK